MVQRWPCCAGRYILKRIVYTSRWWAVSARLYDTNEWKVLSIVGRLSGRTDVIKSYLYSQMYPSYRTKVRPMIFQMKPIQQMRLARLSFIANWSIIPSTLLNKLYVYRPDRIIGKLSFKLNPYITCCFWLLRLPLSVVHLLVTATLQQRPSQGYRIELF